MAGQARRLLHAVVEDPAVDVVALVRRELVEGAGAPPGSSDLAQLQVSEFGAQDVHDVVLAVHNLEEGLDVLGGQHLGLEAVELVLGDVQVQPVGDPGVLVRVSKSHNSSIVKFQPAG